MKKIILLIIFSVSLLHSIAQEDPIDTDRPDQTESAFLVPKNYLQFEAGFNFEKISKAEKEFLLPTLLTRYGIGKKIELRLITTLKKNAAYLPLSTIHIAGLDMVEIGSKISLLEEKKWLPKTSLIFHIGVPSFSSPKYKSENIAPNFRFTMQHTLSSKISLGYNIGCEWDGFTNDPEYIYTLTLGYVPAKNWYSYVESFGGVKNGAMPGHNLDGGIAYNLSKNFKIDLSSGFGLSKNSSQWYISAGLSFRINTKKI